MSNARVLAHAGRGVEWPSRPRTAADRAREPILSASVLARVAFVLLAMTQLASAVSTASAQPFRYPSNCREGCVTWYTYYDNRGRDWACGTRRYGGHYGTDWAMGYGQPIYSAQEGTVTFTRDGCRDDCRTAAGCGCTNQVVMVHPTGTTTEYLHMRTGSVAVEPGWGIGCGAHVGGVGSSGMSTGNHLHFDFWLAGQTRSQRRDPYGGPCSPEPSRWRSQGGYLGVPSGECYVDADGDGSPAGTDCDDGNPRRRPGRAEACDGEENDCDAAIDEALSQRCGTDEGECVAGVETCSIGTWGPCVGEVPPSVERCDTLDNDCDGDADDDRICEYDDAALGALLVPGESDVDGDGLADACMRTPSGFECLLAGEHGFERRVRGPSMEGASWEEPSSYASIRMADVDGDGLDDVCSRSDGRVACFRANGEGFGEALVSLPIDDAGMGTRSAQLWLADVDGDGRADPCVRDPRGLRCQPRGDAAALVLRALSDDEGWGDVARHGTIRFGDVNGDGRDDVCARAESGVRCWLADETGFGELRVGPPWSDARGWGETRYWSTLRIADVNGDEIDDVCGRGPEGFVCALGGYEGFERSLRAGPPMQGAAWDARAAYSTVRLADVNGDGASDLCARTDERLACWLWRGESFERRIAGPRLADADGYGDPLFYESLRLADVNGDERADACTRDAEGVVCWTSDGDSFGEMRRARVWRDAEGLGDVRFTSSLTIAGVTSVPVPASCACAVGDRGGSRGVIAILLVLFAASSARRRRRG